MTPKHSFRSYRDWLTTAKQPARCLASDKCLQIRVSRSHLGKRIVLLFVLTALAATPPSIATSVEDFFPLGVFYEGNMIPPPERFAAECKDILAHNLNTISFANYWINRPGSQAALRVMDELGLRAIIGIQEPSPNIATNLLPQVVEIARQHPSVLAYYLADEPSVAMAPQLALTTELLRQLDPLRPGIACLVGLDRIWVNHRAMRSPILYINPYAASLGNPLGDFRMTGFGYPHMQMGDYIDYARRVAGRNTRLWTIIQTHNWADQLREPTPAEVRAMSWMALARGSTGLIYFIYQTEQGWHGLVHEGKPTDRYQAVASIAETVASIAPTLLRLQYQEAPVALSDTIAEVHTFKHRDSGDLYLICLNRNVERPQGVRLRLLTAATEVVDITQRTTPKLVGDTVGVHLGPGDGTVLRLK